LEELITIVCDAERSSKGVQCFRTKRIKSELSTVDGGFEGSAEVISIDLSPNVMFSSTGIVSSDLSAVALFSRVTVSDMLKGPMCLAFLFLDFDMCSFFEGRFLGFVDRCSVSEGRFLRSVDRCSAFEYQILGFVDRCSVFEDRVLGADLLTGATLSKVVFADLSLGALFLKVQPSEFSQ
jgi:hypothetical protein